VEDGLAAQARTQQQQQQQQQQQEKGEWSNVEVPMKWKVGCSSVNSSRTTPGDATDTAGSSSSSSSRVSEQISTPCAQQAHQS
jgi:hypothetical protein